jgi:hypothetical protein
MQEEIVNSNAMDEMFVAFTMAQQIMTGMSCAASEEEKVSFFTEAVVSLLKCNGGYNSEASESCSIQCQWHWETGL